MKILGILNRLVPDCRPKAAAKAWFINNVLYGLTGPAQEHALKDGITVRMAPFLLVKHSVGNFHLEGYELHRSIQQGDVVVDGGGFQGVFTLYAAKKAGPTGHVITFEPDARLCKLLEKNVKLNGLSNVTIVQKGLWEETGVLAFDSRGNTSRLGFDDTSSHWTQKVPVTTVDDEARRLGLTRLDFIKMNIEGAEIEAVRGCTEVMQKFSPAFAIASDHIRDGVPTAARVQEEIEKRGYTAFSDYPRHLTVYAKSPQAGVTA